MFKLFILFSILYSINGQPFMDIPEYGVPNDAGFPGVVPGPMNPHFYRSKANNQFRRDSNDQQEAGLRKFYQLDFLKNYQLNFTDWSYVWFEFEEMSILNQTSLIKDLRAKQKIIEQLLIQLCEDRCLREFCEMPINQQTSAIAPRNNESWARFAEMKWEQIPLKIKKLIILQLKIDRFRTTNSLTMMVNELCPYNKYFDEPASGNLNRPIGENNSGISKIQATDNTLEGKPIESN